ncbi:hypothetical protein [Bradyrhizobium sp. BR13661]|jgi:hypothetical protein|uniref:hypothetical protein n=1 Tax=Bradyrhizobium sp. BR13661 TaxID=2940622 RepID=UPI0024740A8F|nr:hypothetical protein [Bradyrhizobium sp. BR13661]MDH6263529.1 hypothetical protein [Bradyrhizobium sp. BR13661]
MTVEIIGLLSLIVGVASLFCPPSFIVYVFFASTLLGSAAAFVLDSLGGSSLSPAQLLLGFTCLKLLSVQSIRKKSLLGIRIGLPGFWLLLLAIFAGLSAFFFPRLFAGQTYVFPIRFSKDAGSILLYPAASNLTQTVYLGADFVCFFLFYGFGSDPIRQQQLRSAALMCVILNLVFAVLDLATYATGTTELLAFIRNASYRILNDDQVAGFKRIIGSFNEASVFGFVTLGFFAYTSKLWLLGVRRKLSLTLSLLSLLALVFSTSTTAYVGFAAFFAFAYVETMIRTLRSSATIEATIFLIAVPLIVPIVGVALALNADTSAYIQSIGDQIIFNKLSSDSGIERSSWNAQAWQVFMDTSYLGAGNGSVRASSFPVAVLANLGVIGVILFGLFFSGIFSTGKSRRFCDEAGRQAAQSACIAWLISETVSGASTDLGLMFFAFAAMVCSSAETNGPPAQSGKTHPPLSVVRQP